jgi:hypothetical protein
LDRFGGLHNFGAKIGFPGKDGINYARQLSMLRLGQQNAAFVMGAKKNECVGVAGNIANTFDSIRVLFFDRQSQGTPKKVF